MPSKNIQFDNMPASRRTPGVGSEYNTKMAVNTLPANQHKCIVIGQRTAAGTVAANTVKDIFSDDDAAAYFGRGSIIHLAVCAALKANRYLSLQAIALDDVAGGIAASSPLTITGSATGNGTLRLNVDAQKVDIAIASGDNATAISVAINTQIAMQPNLNIVSSVVGGVVTLIAKNKGAQGNSINLSVAVTAAGVTATVDPMSGGLGSADGIAASSPLTITGPATSNGTLRLGVDEQKVDIVIASGDSANAIATALNAQIAFQPDLPIVATVLAGVVTVIAKNKGALGNSIKLSATVTAAGVTATVVPMSGGFNDPDISAALAVIYNAGHTMIWSAYNDQANLTVLRNHLNAVSAPFEKRRARAVCAHTGTYAQATTLAAALNHGRILELLNPSAPEASYAVAAVMGAIAASEEDPARPLNGMELVGLIPAPMQNWLSEAQIEACLHNGVTPVRVGPGNVVQVVRAVTTYTVNAAGVPDISMLDWTTIGTLDYVANAIEQRIQLRFPRDKKTVRTKARLEDEIMNVLLKLEELEIIEDVQKGDVLIEDDSVDPNRYNTRIKINVVNGLHVVANRLDLIL